MRAREMRNSGCRRGREKKKVRMWERRSMWEREIVGVREKRDVSMTLFKMNAGIGGIDLSK